MFRLSRLAPLLVLALLGCHEKVSPPECQALLDHYVELLAQSDGKTPSTEEIQRMQREARVEAASDPQFARCSEEVSRQELECAMKAHTADDVERCLL